MPNNKKKAPVKVREGIYFQDADFCPAPNK